MVLDRMSMQSGTVEFQACEVATDGGIWGLIRPLERVASALLLIALMPAMLLAAAAIALLSRRSPLVAHLRIGQFGMPFWTLKFRTMWGEAAVAGRGASKPAAGRAGTLARRRRVLSRRPRRRAFARHRWPRASARIWRRIIPPGANARWVRPSGRRAIRTGG